MAVSVLSQASALNPGSDLWILPDTSNSGWTARLDWYLNFQISRAQKYQSPKISPYTQSVVSETGLEPIVIENPKSQSLMIASHSLLPNRWVLLVPWETDLNTWVQRCFEKWAQLKEPSLRIFLPPGQSTGAFQREWKNRHSFEDFTVVLD